MSGQGGWSPKDIGEILRIAALLLGMGFSCLVLHHAGVLYVLGSVAVFFLSVLLDHRWGTKFSSGEEAGGFIFWAIFWPAFLVLLPAFSRVRERERRDRLAREIMED